MVEGVLRYQNKEWVLCGDKTEKIDRKKSLDIKYGNTWRKCSAVIQDDTIVVDGEVIITPELAESLRVEFRQYSQEEL